jgi:hypothetical protein
MKKLLLALLVLLSGCQAFSAVTKVGVNLGRSSPDGDSQAVCAQSEYDHADNWNAASPLTGGPGF